MHRAVSSVKEVPVGEVVRGLEAPALHDEGLCDHDRVACRNESAVEAELEAQARQHPVLCGAYVRIRIEDSTWATPLSRRRKGADLLAVQVRVPPHFSVAKCPKIV